MRSPVRIHAWPLFLRIAAGEIETTETFKPKRPIYVAQDCDPARIEDPLYVLKLFSPGVFWSGLIVNLCGCEVQALQMNS
jgi:hypothetical protein